MNLHLLRRSISYLLFSKHLNGHGIHSPFLYRIISDVFQNNISASIVKSVKSYRKELLTNRSVISVNDLGAGSLKLKNPERRICDIARNSAVRRKYGELLTKLAAEINGKAIIELGTSLGISTLYMALGAPDSDIYTIEGCGSCAEIAKNGFRKNGLKNIDLKVGNFDEHLEKILIKSGVPGLIFIDGNHRQEPLRKYVELALRFCDSESIIIIDDIHLNREMEDAWEEIKGMHDVRVTIDLLQFGLLFTNKKLSKESFMVRY